MDQQLTTFLENKLDGFASRIDARLGGIEHRFDQTQEQIQGIQEQVQENRTLLQENRTLILETREQIVKVREEVGKNRDEIGKNRDEIGKNREQIRQTRVLIEGQHSTLQLLAEGHAAQDEKIDRRFDQADDRRRTDRNHLEGMMKGLFLSLSRRDDELEERFERMEAAG